ncbi:MAG: hypothetical protein WA919_10080 [Coleofasciculaceae cyanobacterium]
MTYRESLSPWAIARLLPNNLQWVIIARYRNRSDADGHLQLLQRRVPQIRFEVIWDLPGRVGNRELLTGNREEGLMQTKDY